MTMHHLVPTVPWNIVDHGTDRADDGGRVHRAVRTAHIVSVVPQATQRESRTYDAQYYAAGNLIDRTAPFLWDRTATAAPGPALYLAPRAERGMGAFLAGLVILLLLGLVGTGLLAIALGGR